MHIDKLIDHAEEARVLNIRAINTPNSINGLRSGLYALEHSAVSIRGIFRGISDAVWYPDEHGVEALPEPARGILRDVLSSIADVVLEFGNLVEAHIYGPTVMSEAALRDSLDRLRAARLATDKRLDTKEDHFAVRELLAFAVVASGRILREFDVRDHPWLRDRTAAIVQRPVPPQNLRERLRYRKPEPRSPIKEL